MDKMEQTFSNVLEIVDYLKAEGWKISKSTIYNHVKDGRLRPGDDGKFKSSTVDRYVLNQRTKRVDGGNAFDRLAEEKQRIQNRKDIAQAELWELKNKIAQGRYVPKDTFELELAHRAMIFKADIETFCRAQAGAIIRLTDGDMDKVPDLIEFMLSSAAAWLNRYASGKEFTVPVPSTDPVLEELDDDDDEAPDDAQS